MRVCQWKIGPKNYGPENHFSMEYWSSLDQISIGPTVEFGPCPTVELDPFSFFFIYLFVCLFVICFSINSNTDKH